MSEALKFSLELEERVVELSANKDGVPEPFVMVELTGMLRDKYLNGMAGKVRTNKEGNVAGVNNFEGLQSGLLGKCLFRNTPAGRKPVSENEINGWPARVQTALFEVAQKMSGLGKAAEGDAKND